MTKAAKDAPAGAPRPKRADPVAEAAAARRAQRAAEELPRPALAAADAGKGILTADLVGTVALAVVSLLAALWPSDATAIASLAVAGVLFLGGCGAFAVGFVRAADRSRYEVIDLAGLFYLTGSAPTAVRRRLLGLWFAQIATAAASVAFVRPPFGVMAPLWGIGLNTLWASRHAVFPARPAARRA